MKTRLSISFTLMSVFILCSCTQNEDSPCQEQETSKSPVIELSRAEWLQQMSEELFIPVERLKTELDENIEKERLVWIMQQHTYLEGYDYVFDISEEEANSLGVDSEFYNNFINDYHKQSLKYREWEKSGKMVFPFDTQEYVKKRKENYSTHTTEKTSRVIDLTSPPSGADEYGYVSLTPNPVYIAPQTRCTTAVKNLKSFYVAFTTYVPLGRGLPPNIEFSLDCSEKYFECGGSVTLENPFYFVLNFNAPNKTFPIELYFNMDFPGGGACWAQYTRSLIS